MANQHLDTRKAQALGYEDALTARVTKAQAVAEYVRHDMDAEDLLADLGDHVSYSGGAVLAALGY